MSKKKLLIWAVILAIPGSIGLLSLQTYESLHEQRLRLWRPTVQQAVDQYLDSYKTWLALPMDQKHDTPWGQGEYGGPVVRQQLQRDQDKRLAVDIAELADGTKEVPSELCPLLYGEGWQEKVEKYQRDQKMYDILHILASVCLVVGFSLIVFVGIVCLFEAIYHCFGRKKKAEIPVKKKEEKPAARPATEKQATVKETLSRSGESTDEKPQTNDGYFESLPLYAKKSISSDGVSPAVQSDASSMTATAIMEKMSSTLMSPEPVLNSLTELTEEVSAIRQFAAQQQDQVRKLQDGYDWMLIRRFCLRVIRCIDNISDRIEQLSSQEQDVNPHTLEDIRDELIFALESSGVEPFKPDVGSAYKGLERYAEAIHERLSNNDPARSGTIARVLRPGYQYLISENDVKIVRCAQVQLYE